MNAPAHFGDSAGLSRDRVRRAPEAGICIAKRIGHSTPIARAWRAFEHALDDKIKQAAIAA